MKIAIIPARGGSKRIPRKNIKLFHGKPMIAYSIDAALASGCFDKVIVSTDDQEIADVALEYGAEVPFLRPEDISDDYATTIDVIQHAMQELKLNAEDKICCIYATAPFIEVNQLLSGLKLLEDHQLDYSYSATEFSFPIQRAFYLNDSGKVEMFYSDHFNTRSQDLTKAYHDAGQFYWGTYEAYKKGTPFFSANTIPVILDISKVQDIDTPSDWKRAELIFNLNLTKK
ncbi:pseudaminic acid cytidylyltransferase [Shewanella kaireitica]|uniref:pseudaminic acid cytidylyltransferase n=1 Tax=Shewanella kaireitica TaxID=212021 RepID=UPI00200C97CA|nr:pseudaminic acid cytidylyltransferase [Shewanella kaireitica]MCL1093797.1 pseudaminic acid cytidylyltransferase [Shewanella kaireitica]